MHSPADVKLSPAGRERASTIAAAPPPASRTLGPVGGSPTRKTNSYDEVPYKSYPYRQTHPERLATIATLFGMQPAPLANCRVLELACASGGNLIPLALQFPGATFVGVDVSARELAEGEAMVAALGLTNITLRHADILDLGPDLGEFDYLIAHGVYSWIPDAVQTRLLEICRRQLAPQGVAYVSYNTYPGWRMRGMIRDMMCYRARSFDAPVDRLRQSRALLDFLSRSVPTEDNAYGILLKDELTQMREKEDSYLFHDYLEDVNQPLYFYQFVEAAEAQGLQYLGEADYRVMAVSNFPREVEAMLHSVSSNRVEMEQYMDFLRNRMFRQTLLCHREVTLATSPEPHSILGMEISSAARPEVEPVNCQSRETVTFRGQSSVVTTSEPIVKAAMVELGRAWPTSIPFTTLYATARSHLQAEPVVVDPAQVTHETRQLAEPLLRCYATSLISLSVQPAPFTLDVGARPRASRLARLQAESGNQVTNLNHETVSLNDLDRHTLVLLDGQRDRAAIVATLAEQVLAHKLVIHEQGTPLADSLRISEVLGEAADACLTRLARLALLEA